MQLTTSVCVELVPISDSASNKKIYQAILHQRIPTERPNARWKYDVENDIRMMGIINWKEVAQDRDGWRRATREEHILLG